MIAAITLTIGWWIIPTIITILCGMSIYYLAKSRPSFMADDSFEFIIALALALGISFIWNFYFILKIKFGIT